MEVTIAIADDHHLLREAIAELLLRYGYNPIIKAYNGLDLINQLQGSEILPDICIIDVDMPLLDGIETTRKLTTCYPNMPVIGFSMHNEESVKEDMISAGAKAYLLKGSSIESICECIDRQVNIAAKTKSARVQLPEINT